MNTRKFLMKLYLLWVLVSLFGGFNHAHAAAGPNAGVNYSVANFAYSPAPTVTTPGTCSVTTTTSCVGNFNCPAGETCNGVAVTGGIRKFMDSLPNLGVANNLQQQIPVAVKDTTTYPGSDYYEIALVEYREQMHRDLPPVTGTWPNQTGGTKLRGYVQEVNGVAVGAPHYLGPIILATKNRPVRIKFTNRLPIGTPGNLFIPVDTTIMGAGMGPLGMNVPAGMAMNYTENRATLHLHGGRTPWISDGTPHQWVVPANEQTPYTSGLSTQNVPDMPLPSNESITFYWTNQQSARLMFYHDHAYGITALNVYAGEAAGYLIVDPAEESALASAGVPGTSTYLAHLIPLIIQDKTFVSSTTATTDPLWDTINWGPAGSLWFPHVYMPNQDPITAGAMGANPLGRWDYGAWFWPIFPSGIPPVTSRVPEAFMDTPIVNGTAYPYINVDPTQYRLRILNACNDRMLNLQLYVADPTVTTADGRTNTEVKMVPAALTTICTAPNVPVGCFPASWAAQTPGMIPDILDSRPSGVPDPTLRGPAMIQIGSEGGILPGPALLTNIPVGFEQNKRNIVVLNVSEKTLFMGPAERSDVIVDFSNFAGKTVILYNDAPAPVPASDPRNDFYTGDPDFSATAGVNNQGGAPTTLAGFGPNTRTIMQFRVGTTGGTSTAPVDDYNAATLAALQTALPTLYAQIQDPPVIGQLAYNQAFGTTAPDQPASIYAGSSLQPTWTFVDGTGATVMAAVPDPATYPTPPHLPPGATMPIFNKTIQELFDPLGRMNATLGVELPFTNSGNQTTVPLGYIDPPTEIIPEGETQIWKITHNGVDTHAIHFHLFDVQVINRVGWDGMVRPTDPNELGWKDTVRMNPLEDIIVAARAKKAQLPFGIPESIRPLDVTMPLSSTFPSFDPITGGPITVSNDLTNFGWEYVWHCHLLDHEENDMMRPMVFVVPSVLPVAPTSLNAVSGTGQISLTWVDGTPFDYNAAFPQTNLGNPANEIGFRIERAEDDAFSVNPTTFTTQANAVSLIDTPVAAGPVYRYRVQAFNAAGNSAWSNVVPTATTANPAPAITSLSPSSAIAGGAAFTLTVNGSNFVSGATVNWNGAARTTTVVSSTQLTAAISAADIALAGTASVTVLTPAPGGGTSSALTFAINNPVPVTTSLSPSSAIVGGAAFTLTVNGSNFINGATVNWNGAARTTTFVSATQLTAAITAADIAAVGTASVTVVNPAPGGGTSNAQTFSINNPVPATTSISPTSAVAGSVAFTLTVNGSNFVNGSVVNWNGAARTTTFISATQLTAAITAADIATAGTASVTVVTAAPGGGTSNAQSFTINNPVPATTSISPSSAIAGGASFTLTVNGSNFVNGSVVNWNGSARATTFVSATQLTAAITAVDIAAAGTASVTVFNATPGGGTSNAQSFTINNPVPATTSISPASATMGSAAFTLTVNGSNFVNGSVVNWKGSARATTFISATQLTAAITAADIAASGTASVTVVNAIPGGGISGAQTFTINNPVPSIIGTSPTSVMVNSGAFTLTVYGSNFVNGAVVNWNGSARTTTFVSATQLSAAITAADVVTAGSASITVVNPAPGGGASSALIFPVNNPLPSTTSISPGSAVRGGAAFTLTVNGSNFVSGSTVMWNGTARMTTFVSSTRVTAAIPASDIAAVGTASVTVFNPTPGGGTSNAQTFTISIVMAPSNVRATGVRVFFGSNDRVTLNWTDNSNNETGFTIQRATNSAFTAGLVTSTVGANVTTFQTGNVPRGAIYYFRVRSYNASGTSAWVNATPFPITTP